MIGRGWRYDELMAMTVSDFAFWHEEQEAFNKAEAEAIRKRSGGR